MIPDLFTTRFGGDFAIRGFATSLNYVPWNHSLDTTYETETDRRTRFDYERRSAGTKACGAIPVDLALAELPLSIARAERDASTRVDARPRRVSKPRRRWRRRRRRESAP